VVQQEVRGREGRFLPSGDESGTAPGDRPFRPDVEGLRAVAVALVVLYHAGLGVLSGGYVGVDVFFVISGFVITGVLLRERATSGATSLVRFYGRRCRRIIPAATLVVVVTVFLTYWFLGSTEGGRTATDGRWASVFLANYHFISVGTSYLASQRPPSPLQNFWSLSVEEQFYVVYPTLFLVLAGIRTRLSLRVRLALGLGIVFCASLAYSVTDTASSPTAAYFSPFTRAWELALGALVAVGTPWLLKMPSKVAAAVTWTGLGAIAVTAFVFTSATPYPGSLVAIPVVGTAAIIAGGVSAPRFGCETLLRLAPLRHLGKWSYSLYLWHWPILIVAAEHQGNAAASFPGSLVWIAVALAASVGTYYLIENPIRHSHMLLHRRWASVGLGAGLVLTSVGIVTAQTGIAFGAGIAVAKNNAKPTSSAATPGHFASLSSVLHLVAASNRITSVSSQVNPPLSQAVLEPPSNSPYPPTICALTGTTEERVNLCTFGDRGATPNHTVVLYGDSHAGMWFHPIEDIASRAKWKLVVLELGGCPPSVYPFRKRIPGASEPQCARFQNFALHAMRSIDPSVVIVSQEREPELNPNQWARGLREIFAEMSLPDAKKIVLGNIPLSGGPACLASHRDDVQACDGTVLVRYNKADQRAASASGARYVNLTPWFCATRCSAIIGDYNVYFNTLHVALGYSRYLEGVLAQALPLS